MPTYLSLLFSSSHYGPAPMHAGPPDVSVRIIHQKKDRNAYRQWPVPRENLPPEQAETLLHGRRHNNRQAIHGVMLWWIREIFLSIAESLNRIEGIE